MDISHKRIWGYQPLLVCFANTKKILAIINRSGNVYVSEDAADQQLRAFEQADSGGIECAVSKILSI